MVYICHTDAQPSRQQMAPMLHTHFQHCSREAKTTNIQNVQRRLHTREASLSAAMLSAFTPSMFHVTVAKESFAYRQ